MKILIASVDPQEIDAAKDYGIHGIITNPTVLLQARRPWREAVQDAARCADGLFHLQAISHGRTEILKEIEEFHSILGERLVAKIMISREGLAAAQTLRSKGIPVNITGVISTVQASVAIQAGADYISLYMNRAERAGIDGVLLVRDVAAFISRHNYPTQIVAASLQGPVQMFEAGLNGADIAAAPFAILEQAVRHPVTDLSAEGFKQDFARIPTE
jgi:TalC/MipB family fructose-6-phosphate aldolase